MPNSTTLGYLGRISSNAHWPWLQAKGGGGIKQRGGGGPQAEQSISAALAKFELKKSTVPDEIASSEQPLSQLLYTAAATQSVALAQPYLYLLTS